MSEGLLVELIDDWWTDNPQKKVRFGFERFSDYFIADSLLKQAKSLDELKTLIAPGGKLDWLNNGNYWERRGVAASLAMLVPGRFEVELLELLDPENSRRPQLLKDFIDSLPWRDGDTITGATHRFLKAAAVNGTPEEILNSLLKISTIPGHPLNADFLHSKLSLMKLPRRDRAWTVPVSYMTNDSALMPLMIVDWAMRVPLDLVSNDQARLVGSVLLWFGSSTVCRFRDSAGHAAIRLLTDRPHVVTELIEQFDDVDDPYVVERLYAVAAGVAMRERSDDGLRVLAAAVYKHVFDTDNVRLHVLLRDYARTVLAYAEHRGVLPDNVKADTFNPTYRSRERRVPSEDRLGALSKDPAWRDITDSIRPNTKQAGTGWYGDFGRYTMQSKTSKFHSTRLGAQAPNRSYIQHYDADRARRWVLDRVKKLGWTPKMFMEHDRRVPDSHRFSYRESKVERIGKKYQWIALHELVGYISDRHHMTERHEYGIPLQYQGPWQLYARNFDLSESGALPPKDEEDLNITDKRFWTTTQPYDSPFNDIDRFDEREQWAKSELEDPSKLLTATDLDHNDWFVLDGHWKWEESIRTRLRQGRADTASMWIHARSWLVSKAESSAFLAALDSIDFWGHGCFGIDIGNGWTGEYPWGDVFCHLRSYCESEDEWINPHGIHPRTRAKHIRSACSSEDANGAVYPGPHLCDMLGLRWIGDGYQFADVSGEVIARAIRVSGNASNFSLVVRRDKLLNALESENQCIVWGILGERRSSNYNNISDYSGFLAPFSAVYTLRDGTIVGDITAPPYIK